MNRYHLVTSSYRSGEYTEFSAPNDLIAVADARKHLYGDERIICLYAVETNVLGTRVLWNVDLSQPPEDADDLSAALAMDLDKVEKHMMRRVEEGLPFPTATDGNALRLLFVRLRDAEARLDSTAKV